jgi:hypothetical protein
MVCTLTHNMYVSDEVSGGKPRSTEKTPVEFTLTPAYTIIGKPVLFKKHP